MTDAPDIPTTADPLVVGGAHVRALIDDIVGQLREYLVRNGSPTAANTLDAAPVAVSTRAWLAALFEATHPELVILPKVRPGEVFEDWYVLGVTGDDQPVEARFTPRDEHGVRIELRPAGQDDDRMLLTADSEGARVTFLAGLAMAMHTHPSIRPTDQTNTTTPEVTEGER